MPELRRTPRDNNPGFQPGDTVATADITGTLVRIDGDRAIITIDGGRRATAPVSTLRHA